MEHKATIDFNQQCLRLNNYVTIPWWYSKFLSTSHLSSSMLQEDILRQTQIQQLLSSIPNIFATNEPTVTSAGIYHEIPTRTSRPVASALRCRSREAIKVLCQNVEAMLRAKVIRHSKSPWVSEPHLVKKADGTYRFCVDFRKLNKVRVQDEYPLPRLDNILDSLENSKYFTTLALNLDTRKFQ